MEDSRLFLLLRITEGLRAYSRGRLELEYTHLNEDIYQKSPQRRGLHDI